MAVARIRQWLTKETKYKSGIACNMLNDSYRQPLWVLPYFADRQIRSYEGNLKLHTKTNTRAHPIESAPSKDQIPTTRLSVEKVMIYDWATMVHKILKEICPEFLKGKFIRRTQISKYRTQRINDLQIPKLQLELSKRSFSYVGAKVWNDIPNDIRNMESTDLFKHKMKTYLLGQ